MLTINELRKTLDLGDYGEYLMDYKGIDMSVDEILFEIADNRTSMYYNDIIKFISEHVNEVSDTIVEYGWDGVGADLYKAGQTTECRLIEQGLQEHVYDALKLLALEQIKRDLELTEISENQLELIEDYISNMDISDTPEELENYVNELIMED